MKSLSIDNAMIAYNPPKAWAKGQLRPGTLKIVEKDDFNVLSPAEYSWNAYDPYAGLTDAHKLAQLLVLFRHLTVLFGIPAETVDKEFRRITEYAAAVLDQ